MAAQTYRAGRQDHAAEALGPALRIAFHRDIEPRLLAMRGGDRVRHLLSVGLAPPGREPGGRVLVERIGGGEKLFAAPGEVAQDTVDQGGERRGLRIETRFAHSEIDGSVV